MAQRSWWAGPTGSGTTAGRGLTLAAAGPRPTVNGQPYCYLDQHNLGYSSHTSHDVFCLFHSSFHQTLLHIVLSLSLSASSFSVGSPSSGTNPGRVWLASMNFGVELQTIEHTLFVKVCTPPWDIFVRYPKGTRSPVGLRMPINTTCQLCNLYIWVQQLGYHVHEIKLDTVHESCMRTMQEATTDPICMKWPSKGLMHAGNDYTIELMHICISYINQSINAFSWLHNRAHAHMLQLFVSFLPTGLHSTGEKHDIFLTKSSAFAGLELGTVGDWLQSFPLGQYYVFHYYIINSFFSNMCNSATYSILAILVPKAMLYNLNHVWLIHLFLKE